jgi:hypothetical protein
MREVEEAMKGMPIGVASEPASPPGRG